MAIFIREHPSLTADEIALAMNEPDRGGLRLDLALLVKDGVIEANRPGGHKAYVYCAISSAGCHDDLHRRLVAYFTDVVDFAPIGVITKALGIPRAAAYQALVALRASGLVAMHGHTGGAVWGLRARTTSE